ncbi:MAG: bifunctional folylpolyglutamate synthase/dihydrofolate synthase [Cyanobacteria bacterium]|nr:bifunctional folylpolyglutamate synthase/dihydrofolate synthase [Cyanobacteria bacterium CG_2015-16_32_12]NCO76958.1 bifunctional folylpolyglutamate synthase/dihydrofolate synthase [Cyanobacteria bacterium CG_2015-22_32_23]NCQ04313.1 bifunctional folylpolyglutamate synthase/dihydrofolate synthase [Cyanobacteria bacterium CG_2015-09_32_10]NCQ40772.1 bifunctional folylpolyglutamate synthase/dihydrofolate synthase [Cyanobacteria bacterium CG_2015-04_32_10]NCS85031.1 bifunctional folylpolyglutam
METNINLLLEYYQKFGIDLSLNRIENLLNLLGNPHKKVPIIHVAGTNGKGSVCAYLSSIFTQAGYKTGRYTSPHLVNWNERICLNEQPITEKKLVDLLTHINKIIDLSSECPTQFEVITAAAWLFFAQSQVDIAIIEVGLGGRLDATNVCDRPLASIITSISREHWQRLGNTLEKIATEKAGIIKQECPTIIGNLPPSAKEVVEKTVKKLNCPTIWVESGEKISKNGQHWAKYQDIEYPLSLKGDIQLQNSALAIATVKTLQSRGWNISIEAIEKGMSETRWRGRIEWVTWKGEKILIDGAHNVAASEILREYVDTLDKEIIWVMGMLETKDHQGIFRNLLRPQDQLNLVPVPDHITANPEQLAKLATEIEPNLTKIDTYQDLFLALEAVIKTVNREKQTIVICGSLYLLGYFIKVNP